MPYGGPIVEMDALIGVKCIRCLDCCQIPHPTGQSHSKLSYHSSTFESFSKLQHFAVCMTDFYFGNKLLTVSMCQIYIFVLQRPQKIFLNMCLFNFPSKQTYKQNKELSL